MRSICQAPRRNQQTKPKGKERTDLTLGHTFRLIILGLETPLSFILVNQTRAGGAILAHGMRSHSRRGVAARRAADMGPDLQAIPLAARSSRRTLVSTAD